MFPHPTLVNTVADRLLLPGMCTFTRLGFLLRQRTWQPLDEDLAGRHVVVTGATSGIGLATATRLAAMGATVTLVGRDAARVEALRRDLAADGGDVRAEVADLSLLEQVRALAGRLLEHDDPIHVLVNNAGALFDEYALTAEGLERSLALNLLSPFLLTQLLMPRLTRHAPARIVTVSSGGMYLAPLDVQALRHPPAKGYNGSWAYALAKRALVTLTGMWAEELLGSDVDVYAMHPGWADTAGVRGALPLFHRLTAPVLRSPEEGADTVVYLAAADAVRSQSGAFWFDREVHPQHVLPWTPESRAAREALWAMLLALTHYGEMPNQFAGTEERSN